MECNKDEAFRAKTIAEKKLLERDITGAKKFGLKAQRLYPKLDGLYEFLVMIDVYVAHENKINGESDYYKILGVDHLANEEALKKQYKRMALCLHPDKNKSVKAGEAFKIMSQAWSVLSDKNKRNAYDLKVNVKASNHSGRSFPATTSNPQSVPTQPQTPGTATNPQSKPTQNTATKPQSAPTRPHTPCTATSKPQTRTHTPVEATTKPKSVPTRPHSPCTATSKPQTRTHTPVAATTKPKSVPTRAHAPCTTTNPQSKPTQNTTTKPQSASTRPHTPCTATKPQTRTHTPVTSPSLPKSLRTRSHAPCTATNPQTQRHTPVTATTKSQSVPAPTQHTQGTTYTYNFKVNIALGASNNSGRSFPANTSNPQSKPTQNTATRPHTAPTTPCTATEPQTPTHTPVTATIKPKSVPTRSHAPCSATNPQTRTHTPVTATKRKSIPTQTKHTQGTATKRKCIPTPAQYAPGTAFKCKTVPTNQSQSQYTPTNLHGGPQTPGTTTSQPCKFVPCHLRNQLPEYPESSGSHLPKPKVAKESLKRL